MRFTDAVGRRLPFKHCSQPNFHGDAARTAQSPLSYVLTAKQVSFAAASPVGNAFFVFNHLRITLFITTVSSWRA